MLAASICREVHFTVLSSTTMASRVPRCLFGKPNSRDTADMLQEALEVERNKFAKRWGVDPRKEEKQFSQHKKSQDKSDQSPKKRSNPYSRQTNIHDYWRSRKSNETTKKNSGSLADNSMKQQSESSKTTKMSKTAKTTKTSKTVKASKKN